jgi:hypothetical protein
MTNADDGSRAGHYVAWCAASQDSETGEVSYDEDPDKQEWYKFDDDKVSVVSKEKILALEGGGAFLFSLTSLLPFVEQEVLMDRLLADAQERTTRPTSFFTSLRHSSKKTWLRPSCLFPSKPPRAVTKSKNSHFSHLFVALFTLKNSQCRA